ncbi:MAG: hypothetical protein CVU04_01805, partial [Bacteroidetes bacterium HGW-Bacteroidetes-20]
MTFFKHLSLLFSLFLITFSLQAQIDPPNKIVFGESDSLVILEPILDSVEEENEDDLDDFGKDESMIFIYFDWMSGYGT